jgi:hypothetical protein
MANRYEYRVLELREKMIGGKLSGEKLEKIFERARIAGLAAEVSDVCRCKGPPRTGRSRGLAGDVRTADWLTAAELDRPRSDGCA